MRVRLETSIFLVACAVVLLSVMELASSAPTNKCMLKCMRNVLKCKREANLGMTTGVDCCDKYTMCYFECEPDATEAPSCRSKKNSWSSKRGSWKRGSWNKRDNPMADDWADKGGQLSDNVADDLIDSRRNPFYK